MSDQNTAIDFMAMAQADGPESSPEQPQSPQNLPAVHNPLDMVPARTALAKFEGEINRLVHEADELRIDGDASNENAVVLGKSIKQVARAIEDRRKMITGPALTFKQSVDALAKKLRSPLEAAERTIKNKMNAYRTEQEIKRRAAEKKAREAAEAEQKRLAALAKKEGVEMPAEEAAPPAPIEPPETVVRTEVGSASVRKTWTFEITDAAQVPREFMVVDTKGIGAAVKAGAREIPGVRIYQKTDTVFR